MTPNPMLTPEELTARLADAHTERARLDRVIAWLEQGLELHHQVPVTVSLVSPRLEEVDFTGYARKPVSAEDLAQDGEPPVVASTFPHPAGEEPDPPSELDDELDELEAELEDEPERPPPGPPDPPPDPLQPPPRAGQRDHVAKVLSCVLTAPNPVARRWIEQETGLSTAQVTAALQWLMDEKRIEPIGERGGRKYKPGKHTPHSEAGRRTAEGRKREAARLTDSVAKIGLRDKVMQAVAADPMKLDNALLADKLDASLDDIADAVEHLVANDRLAMHDNGTYYRSVGETARGFA